MRRKAMRRIRITAAGTLLLAATLAVGSAGMALAKPSSLYLQAVAAPDRSDKDRERDAREHPAEVLAFAGFKPGMRIADLFGGGGYYSEIIDHVVGPGGHVVLVNNPPYASFAKEDLEARFRDGRLPRIERQVVPAEDLHLGTATLDGALFVMSYHDLYFERGSDFPHIDAAQFLEQVRRAMRPGARLLVVDHAALPGTGSAAAQTLHRIDEKFAIRDIESHGFKLVGRFKGLRNASDDHTKLVFDPAVRGHTDRFVHVYERR
jgi:predicted methyltransferase